MYLENLQPSERPCLNQKGKKTMLRWTLIRICEELMCFSIGESLTKIKSSSSLHPLLIPLENNYFQSMSIRSHCIP